MISESDCNFMQALLQDQLDGILDPLARIILEEHLKTCRKCRKESAELKLLFWDLNDKNNYEVNLPAELDTVKENLLQRFAEHSPAKKTPEIIRDVTRRNIRAARMFLNYVPGARTGNKILKKSAAAAPAALGKVSKALVKTTRSLLAK
ncbi:MAG: anti-sigma factor family protein [Desulfitobacteriia bacterium]